jgi:hypothetical protein
MSLLDALLTQRRKAHWSVAENWRVEFMPANLLIGVDLVTFATKVRPMKVK